MSASIEFPFPTVLKNLDTPMDDADSATKGYVDAEIADAVIEAGAGGIASAVSFQPNGNITSENVQAALVELDDLTVKSAGDTMTGQLVMEVEPTIANHVTTKKYVDTQLTTRLATKLSTFGGTLSGPLVLSDAPTVALGAATKDYVDTQLTTHLATKLSTDGGTLSGPLVLSDAPTVALGAATKDYVDTAVAAKLNISGGTITGNLAIDGDLTIDIDNTKITGGIAGKVLTVSRAGDLIWAYPGEIYLEIDFVQAGRTINTPTVGANTTLVLNRIVNGTGSLRDDYNTTTGTFVLRANETYNIVFNPYWGQFSDKNNGYVTYEVVHAANNTPIMSNFSGYGVALPVTWNNTSTAANGDKSLVSFVITPTANITAKINTVAATGTASLSSQGTLLTINRLSMFSYGPSGSGSGASSAESVAKAGDTMTGPLVLSGLPTAAEQAASKAYVDQQINLLPSSITPLDYVKVAFSADYNTPTTVNAPIVFSKVTASGGAITYDTTTGAFLLRANKTYHLRAAIGGSGTSSTSHLTFMWRNTANAIIGGSSVGLSCSMTTRLDAMNPIADAIYTPTDDENVFLKVTSSQSGSIIARPDNQTGWASAWATIIQLR
jgi:hypothetical protein